MQWSEVNKPFLGQNVKCTFFHQQCRIFPMTNMIPLSPRETECSMITPGHLISDVASRDDCQRLCTDGN